MVDWWHLAEIAANLGAGGLLMAAGRWLGKRLDLPVITLQIENERLRGDIKKLGEKYDNLEARALAVAVQVRQNPAVDDALVDDMPTGIRDMADLITKKTPSEPPSVERAIKDYLKDK